jgi:hypothetical protein
MNPREGTRRLALLLGAVGAIFGGFASYLELHTILEQRARHNRFEQLAASDVVQRERKCLLAGMTSGCSDDPYAATAIQAPSRDQYAATFVKAKPTVAQVLQDPKFYGLSTAAQKIVLSRLDPDFRQLPAQEQDKVFATSKSKLSPPHPNSVLPTRQTELNTITGVTLDFSTSVPIPSVVMKGGIKTVNWNHDYGIDSIEMEDGQTIYPTPAPSAWLYSLIALFPILGFFIPWGAVRAIGWVGAGFAASPK